MFGQLTTAVQFYLYGRRHFTATGWQRAAARYNPSDLDALDLDARTYLVTGANSGIGLTLSKYLARRGATLFMVCRNPERAARAPACPMREPLTRRGARAFIERGDARISSCAR